MMGKTYRRLMSATVAPRPPPHCKARCASSATARTAVQFPRLLLASPLRCGANSVPLSSARWSRLTVTMLFMLLTPLHGTSTARPMGQASALAAAIGLKARRSLVVRGGRKAK